MPGTALQRVAISAQDKWEHSDTSTRREMLAVISHSISFAPRAWRKLPHTVKMNLTNIKSWTI